MTSSPLSNTEMDFSELALFSTGSSVAGGSSFGYDAFTAYEVKEIARLVAKENEVAPKVESYPIKVAAESKTKRKAPLKTERSAKVPSLTKKKKIQVKVAQESTSGLPYARTQYVHDPDNHFAPPYRKEFAVLEPHGLPAIKTAVDNHWLYVFFRFCAERHSMEAKREAGVERDELTLDEAMRNMRVRNVFRELDSGSRAIRDSVILVGEQTIEEVCFRVFRFCGFSLFDTWQALVEGLGEIPSWRKFNLKKYEAILHHRSIVERKKIYTSAFQLVPPTRHFGSSKQGNIIHYAATLRFVQSLMEMGLPAKIASCQYAEDASEVIRTVPELGPFLSLNIICYLNQSPLFTMAYRNFATCGPGSRNFLKVIFGPDVIVDHATQQAGLKWLYENQWRYWYRICQDPPFAPALGCRPGMRVLDFENALCWCHRYVHEYLSNSYSSVADLAPPLWSEIVEGDVGMPAWCEEEKWARGNVSKPVLKGDYGEEALKQKSEDGEEDVYEVEKVVCRFGGRTRKDGVFRVRWKGWPPEEDTWEKQSMLMSGAQEALDEWLDWEKSVYGTIERVRVENPFKIPTGVGELEVEIENEAVEDALESALGNASEDDLETDL